MEKHWSDTPIHVLDFEGSRATGIVEYGVVTLRGTKVDHVATRICGTDTIPEVEARVHGIRDADAAGMAPFAEERARFFELRSSGPLCAHNAHVEAHLLKQYWPYPRLAPDFQNAGREVADWGPWIDTLRLYELVFPMLSEHGLRALVEAFGLQGELDQLAAEHCPEKRRRYHCALYDALASALLLIQLARLPGFEGLSLDWLLMMSGSGEDGSQGELF